MNLSIRKFTGHEVDWEDIAKIDRFPNWVKDDADKIIYNELFLFLGQYTSAQLKNLIYSGLMRKYCTEPFDEKIKRLTDSGVLSKSEKEITVKVLQSVKEKVQ